MRITPKPANRDKPLISLRLPSAKTAVLEVFYDTAKPWAVRATVRFPTTSPSSAHRVAPRESLTRTWAALAGILAPHMSAATTAVAPHPDQQSGWSPPEELVRQPTHHRATRVSPTATPVTPVIGLNDTAGQHRTPNPNILPNDFKAELVKAGEHGQVRSDKDSVGHVEVFQMDTVTTSINGRPRPSSRHQHADPCPPPLQPRLRRAGIPKKAF